MRTDYARSWILSAYPCSKRASMRNARFVVPLVFKRRKIVNQREKSFPRMLTALPGFTIGLKYAYLTDGQGASRDIKKSLWPAGERIGEAVREKLVTLNCQRVSIEFYLRVMCCILISSVCHAAVSPPFPPYLSRPRVH